VTEDEAEAAFAAHSFVKIASERAVREAQELVDEGSATWEDEAPDR
jgi:hypothetical protein